ncbi:MAG: SRPBCC family protein [Flavisolibacter sp.]
MWKKIALSVVVIIAGFLGYVSTREGKFHYERSGYINASQSENLPNLSNLRLGSERSPYEAKDKAMKKTYSGTDGAVGSALDFEGNSDVGAGRVEVIAIHPDNSVELRLTMTKPMVVENKIIYKLMQVEQGSVFTWVMEGDSGFMGKLFCIFIDCDKMMGDDFAKGISNLKTIIEGKKA